MKTVLVIGGDSFIAQNFIAQFSDHYNIIALSRKKTNFANELLLKDFWNITDDVFSKANVVINFAAIVHATKKIKKEHFYEINHKLAVENATKAKRNCVGQFIQMSTIAVYGQVNYIDNNIKEKPIDAYGHSKLLADNELLKLDDDKFKVTIIRPSMVYGGGNAPGNMMRLIKLVDKNLPLPFKDIHNKRFFLNIDNLIVFLYEVIKKNLNGKFILSDKEGISIFELVKLISKSLGKDSRQFRIPSLFIFLIKLVKPGVYFKLFSSLNIDCQDSYQCLDYQPEYSLQQGIDKMVEYYRKNK